MVFFNATLELKIIIIIIIHLLIQVHLNVVIWISRIDLL